jgi:hypothetical protein
VDRTLPGKLYAVERVVLGPVEFIKVDHAIVELHFGRFYPIYEVFSLIGIHR